jgi:alkylation response protein AidB-like acyl-CoA dehydrogenase
MSEVKDLAETLAEEFRATTRELDLTGEFPTSNYARMREVGYLRASVPKELGGLGAGLADMARAQQALARGCAATALAVNMHHFQVGVMADAWRKGGPDALLRRVAQEGVVLASTGAEAIVAGEWTTATTAELQGDDYLLNGRKYFCSQAPGMDFVRVNARDVATGELLIFSVPTKTQGVNIVETWDTTGMRATASHDLVLENVRLPQTAVGARLPAGAPMRSPPLAKVGRWFLPLISSVYLGLAEEARSEALKASREGVNSASRDPVLTDVLFGELEAEFFIATSVRDRAVSELGQEPQDLQAALALAILCKEVVTSHAASVVDKAVQIVGGRSYFKRSPLERLSRDMRAARFHPPAAPVSFQMIGERVRS